MKWIEISITTSLEASEAVSELLMDKGANGTEMVDPYAFKEVLEKNRYLDYADDGFIESFGTDVIVKAYFSEDRDPANMVDEIRSQLSIMSESTDVGPGIVSWEIRDDSQWKDTWKDYYKPFNFTERIVIRPSWEHYTPKEGEIVIELDPGMAFGTGTHETTRMCALLGEKYIKPGDEVLDLGCGTAILAISAVKLGARHALAVDIDDAAVKAARENVQKNDETSRIEVKHGILADVDKKPYSLVFINIIADVILSIAPEIMRYLGKKSRVILSGIIKDRREEVLQAYTALGLQVIEEINMGEWVAIALHA